MEPRVTGGWIGIDLDGTLAYDVGHKDANGIGPPVPRMLSRVKKFLAQGRDVKIFTARASDPSNVPGVKAWLQSVGLPDLDVTNAKDEQMDVYYDDHAIQVETNTGKRVDGGL